MANQTEDIARLTSVVKNLLDVQRAQAVTIAKQPAAMQDLKDQYDLASHRAKRDRDGDPAKKSTIQQLDVIQESLLELGKAKRSLQNTVVQAPVLDGFGDAVRPVVLERQAVTTLPGVDNAMEALEKGITLLQRRESALLVVLGAESNKQGYAAVEACELAEGGEPGSSG
jgi:hypothetical protein